MRNTKYFLYLYQPLKNEEKIMPRSFKEGRNSQSNVLRFFFKSITTDEMNAAFEKARKMIYP